MKRTALVVGVNYLGTPAQLAGCVQDALDWDAVLRSRGYDVTLRLEKMATKANVLADLRSHVSAARWRDRFVFCFSGHGTWVPDTDGDEIDRRDEALCPIDYDSAGVITDDELHEVFSAARFGVSITVLSDSCHSGTVARALVPAERAPLRSPKFVSPADIAAIRVDRATAAVAELRAPARTRSRPRAVLLSGCEDHEFSYDAWFGDRPNGAFTRAAIDTLRDRPKSVKVWHDAIRDRLPSDAFPQSPQLGATAWQRRRRPLD